MTVSKRARQVTAFLAFSLFSLQAWSGEPSAADRETARTLMATGRAKREAGDLKGALQAFAAADSLMGVPTTGYELAKTQAALGLLVEARDLSLRVARSNPTAGEPGPFAEARHNAETLAAELEDREPSIKVVPSVTPADLTVFVDDAVLPTAAVGVPRKVNPGEHTVRVRVSSGAENKTTVTVAERQNIDVPIDVPNALASTQLDTTTPSKGPSAGAVLAIAGFSLGAIGLGVGALTGVLSIDKTGTIKQQCNPQCPASQADALSSARTLATISDVGFIAGGVGVAVGVTGLILLVTHPSKTAANVQPYFGWASGGVSGRF